MVFSLHFGQAIGSVALASHTRRVAPQLKHCSSIVLLSSFSLKAAIICLRGSNAPTASFPPNRSNPTRANKLGFSLFSIFNFILPLRMPSKNSCVFSVSKYRKKILRSVSWYTTLFFIVLINRWPTVASPSSSPNNRATCMNLKRSSALPYKLCSSSLRASPIFSHCSIRYFPSNTYGNRSIMR